jgi:hypothetical protein
MLHPNGMVPTCLINSHYRTLDDFTWIDNALMEQPKPYQFGPKRGGVCK